AGPGGPRGSPSSYASNAGEWGTKRPRSLAASLTASVPPEGRGARPAGEAPGHAEGVLGSPAADRTHDDASISLFDTHLGSGFDFEPPTKLHGDDVLALRGSCRY